MTQSAIQLTDLTVNDIIRLYPNTVQLFRDYGIDACCGGGLSLSDAAGRHNIDLAQLVAAVASASGASLGEGAGSTAGGGSIG